MSRALNITATEAQVRTMCAKHKAPISAIETLPGGATRVVLLNGTAAAAIRRAYGKNVITTMVARTPLSPVIRGAVAAKSVRQEG